MHEILTNRWTTESLHSHMVSDLQSEPASLVCDYSFYL